MTNSRFDNVKFMERLARLCAGGALIAAIFFPGISAYWLALLAIYPVMTAIMAWDPLYALAHELKSHLPAKSRMTPELPV